MTLTEQARAATNFPQRYRNLSCAAAALLHSIAALKAMASEAIRSGDVFTWPHEQTPGCCVSRQEFYDVIGETRGLFLLVRNEFTEPWIQVSRLLSLGERTDWALSVLLEIQRKSVAEFSPDQRSQLDEARDALSPLTMEERAVFLELINAEIRLATSRITPRFDPELPGDFICELQCSKEIPAITPEARAWIEAHLAAVERQVHALKLSAPYLEFAECPALHFVGHIGLIPVTTEGECLELRKILAFSVTTPWADLDTKPPANQGSSAGTSNLTRDKKLSAILDEAMMNHVDLAAHLELDPEALRSRLNRWRDDNSDGWQETTEPRSRQPKFTYRVGAIRHILRAACASA